MTPACIAFGQRVLTAEMIRGARVLEVGAYDVNGSFRPLAATLGPAEYLGADITPGPRVDVICDAASLEARFGPQSFDVVITTEMLEHVEDWRAVSRNLKAVLRLGGWLVLTTRAPGFARHDWPGDHWRYTEMDLQTIFGDLEIVECIEDRSDMGAFLLARRVGELREPEPGFDPHPVS